MTEKIKVKIETQQLLYHLTSLANLPSILENGLMSRFDLDGDFEDVADAEILEGREKYNLHKMVPFHFLQKSI
ncbi:DarT ssDNA thymidine ADP-ribosyltransferase family protein [Enterobacter cloacae]